MVIVQLTLLATPCTEVYTTMWDVANYQEWLSKKVKTHLTERFISLYEVWLRTFQEWLYNLELLIPINCCFPLPISICTKTCFMSHLAIISGVHALVMLLVSVMYAVALPPVDRNVCVVGHTVAIGEQGGCTIRKWFCIRNCRTDAAVWNGDLSSHKTHLFHLFHLIPPCCRTA